MGTTTYPWLQYGNLHSKLESLDRTIEASKENTDRVLELINENYRRFLEANITHHKYLRDAAEECGDLAGVMHHQVLAETYQSMMASQYAIMPASQSTS